jgi:hypothetical protein
MSTVYLTEFSDLSNIPKKDAKVIESQFPFVPPDDVKFEPCGQIVQKGDIGSNVKFCPICDYPMIVRIMNLPCQHVMCYECSQPDKGYCYICEEEVTKYFRVNDITDLYECDFPDCFKFFESKEKLKSHKAMNHGLNEGNMNLNFNFGVNFMMNKVRMNNNCANPLMPIQYMIAPQNLAQQQNNANSINQMNTLNNNMIPNNINNLINASSNNSNKISANNIL